MVNLMLKLEKTSLTRRITNAVKGEYNNNNNNNNNKIYNAQIS